MADKEATVYIIDVGASMGAKHHGRTQSDLDWAMTYVWDKITSTVGFKFAILRWSIAEARQGCYGP
jgi:ATP-dependent DNA helicase 2 subunit 2